MAGDLSELAEDHGPSWHHQFGNFGTLVFGYSSQPRKPTPNPNKYPIHVIIFFFINPPNPIFISITITMFFFCFCLQFWTNVTCSDDVGFFLLLAECYRSFFTFSLFFLRYNLYSNIFNCIEKPKYDETMSFAARFILLSPSIYRSETSSSLLHIAECFKSFNFFFLSYNLYSNIFNWIEK